MSNPYWLRHIKEYGVRLNVEIDLTFDEFKRFLNQSHGAKYSDDQVGEFWHVAHRRILPPDPGSFSGIGFDINCIVKSAIK